MFTRRPQRGDNEDDLLEFQKEFLASGQQPSAKVVKCYGRDQVSNGGRPKELNALTNCGQHQSTITGQAESMEDEIKKYDTHITTVLSELVQEKNLGVTPAFPTFQSVANPQALPRKYKKQSHFAKSKKRSLFAQQFGNSSEDSKETDSTTSSSSIPVLSSDLHQIYPSSRLLTGDGLKSFDRNEGGVVQAIHEENIAKLSRMSADDIAQEQHKLQGSLDSKILAFLKKRSKYETEPVLVKKEFESNLPSTKAPIDIDEKWIHMNEVEAEKMKWMEEISNKNNEEISLPNRFDFRGHLLSVDESEQLPSHMGLHHHGNEPHLAGYTLQELLSLARSQFSQQQVFAFRLLAKVIHKDKSGEHFAVLSQFVTPLLVDAGFVFIARWALDQRSDNCIQAAIEALHALLYSGKLQDAFLDECFLHFRGCEFPSFDPSYHSGKSSKDETDYELVARDLVKGLMQMDIVIRIRYVLEVCQPDQSVINNCLEILQRCCQHSTEAAAKILDCSRLVDFVVKNYLPMVWHSDLPENEKQPSSWPCVNAVRFLRMLCQAGRHVTSRLIHDFPRVKSFLFKLFASNEVRTSCDWSSVTRQAWMLWTVCLSYGFYIDLYRELFPSLLMQVRSCIEIIEGNLSSEDFHWIKYLLKAIAAVFHNLSTDEKMENLYPRWKEVKEFYSLVQTITRKAIVQYSASKIEEQKVDLCSVISLSVNIMTSCFEKVHFISDDIESEVFPFIIQPLQVIVVECASVLKKFVRIPVDAILKSLPDLHLSTLTAEQGDDVLISAKKVIFVTSFLRFSYVLCRSNRGMCAGMVNFFAEWIKMDERNDIAMSNWFGFCGRTNQHCMFWLSKLYITCVIEVPALRAISQHMHLICLQCISSLGLGDEDYLRTLLCSVVFCIDYFSDSSTSISSTQDSILNFLSSIRSTYTFLSICAPKVLEASINRCSQDPNNLSSLLLPPDDGALLPADWPFLPLVHFYDRAIHEGEPADEKSTDVVKSNVKSCLHFLLFLRQHRTKFLSNLNVTAKITRLMCLYMAGSDVFFDDLISSMMKLLFQLYTRDQNVSVDFSLPVPGVMSFYDFYMSLLDQYEGVSYGDALFTAVILLPVTASSASNFKLALWAEHSEALRWMSLTEEKILLPKQAYLSPLEVDVIVIRAYLRALLSGHCHSQRCPFLYEMALHHVGSYLSNEINPQNLRNEMIHITKKLSDQDLRDRLLNYQQSVD